MLWLSRGTSVLGLFSEGYRDEEERSELWEQAVAQASALWCQPYGGSSHCGHGLVTISLTRRCFPWEVPGIILCVLKGLSVLKVSPCCGSV